MIWMTLLLLYLLPTFVAALRAHRQLLAIFATNLLLGWTLLGWIVAFIWSCTAPRAAVVVLRMED